MTIFLFLFVPPFSTYHFPSRWPNKTTISWEPHSKPRRALGTNLDRWCHWDDVWLDVHFFHVLHQPRNPWFTALGWWETSPRPQKWRISWWFFKSLRLHYIISTGQKEKQMKKHVLKKTQTHASAFMTLQDTLEIPLKGWTWPHL